MKLFMWKEEYRKKKADADKAEAENIEIQQRLKKQQKDAWIIKRASGCLPLIDNEIAEIISRTDGERKVTFKWLCVFLPDEQEEVLKVVWKEMKRLNGLTYVEDEDVYILRRW